MKVKCIWGRVMREWGYEVRVDFEDEDGSIYNECLVFPNEPTEEELNDEIERRKQTIENGKLYIDTFGQF